MEYYISWGIAGGLGNIESYGDYSWIHRAVCNIEEQEVEPTIIFQETTTFDTFLAMGSIRITT